MLNRLCITVVLAISFLGSSATNIVISNDDGWAVAQIRAEYAALKTAGYNVILSAPAVNKSGSSSLSTTPSVLTTACEYNTCVVGSPAYGTDGNDSNIHYVNGYPVDAVKYGIKTYAPAAWGSAPTLVVSGTNVGNNLGSLTVLLSGTVGAACEAALEGIPSIAFSGASGSEVSYTTLTTPTLDSTIAANIYSALAVKFTNALLANSGAILPSGITLNVNFAATTSCTSAASYKFVLTRIASISFSSDVTTCGTSRLPTESNAITQGCIATVSVMNASTKGDVSAANQAIVLAKLSPILSCL